MTNPEWTTVDLAEPWWRDIIGGTIAEHAHDLDDWSLRIAKVYGKSGSLEVSACVLALRAEIARLAAITAADDARTATLTSVAARLRAVVAEELPYADLPGTVARIAVVLTECADLLDPEPGRG